MKPSVLRDLALAALALFAIAVLATCGSVATAAGPKLKRCLIGCFVDQFPHVCLYDALPVCDHSECIERAGVVCRPRMVTIWPANEE